MFRFCVAIGLIVVLFAGCLGMPEPTSIKAAKEEVIDDSNLLDLIIDLPYYTDDDKNVQHDRPIILRMNLDSSLIAIRSKGDNVEHRFSILKILQVKNIDKILIETYQVEKIDRTPFRMDDNVHISNAILERDSFQVKSLSIMGRRFLSSPIFSKPVATGKKKVVYRVKKNDTLITIADQFGVTTKEVMAWNKLLNSKILYNQNLILWQ